MCGGFAIQRVVDMEEVMSGQGKLASVESRHADKKESTGVVSRQGAFLGNSGRRNRCGRWSVAEIHLTQCPVRILSLCLVGAEVPAKHPLSAPGGSLNSGSVVRLTARQAVSQR